MRLLGRLLLLVFALVIDGGLGYLLLLGFEPLKIIMFAAACFIWGEIFYQIDNRLFK